ncbi:hypothetical protein AAY473_037412 [Plecturocebus cupreus]
MGKVIEYCGFIILRNTDDCLPHTVIPQHRYHHMLWKVDMGFHHVGQAGLELLTSSDSPASASQSSEITGMSDCAWPPLPDPGHLTKSDALDLESAIDDIKNQGPQEGHCGGSRGSKMEFLGSSAMGPNTSDGGKVVFGLDLQKSPGLTLLLRQECSGAIIVHCNLKLLGSKMGSCYGAQAGLKLLASSNPPTLASQSAKNTRQFHIYQVHLFIYLETGCHLGWSAMAQSRLTATSASQAHMILPPQPSKQLGLQAWFHHNGQASLKLLGSSNPPTLAFQSAGITGMSHGSLPLLETGFRHVAQAGLKSLDSYDPPALDPQSAMITGLSHSARPNGVTLSPRLGCSGAILARCSFDYLRLRQFSHLGLPNSWDHRLQCCSTQAPPCQCKSSEKKL